jgi:hypothetical protein
MSAAMAVVSIMTATPVIRHRDTENGPVVRARPEQAAQK